MNADNQMDELAQLQFEIEQLNGAVDQLQAACSPTPVASPGNCPAGSFLPPGYCSASPVVQLSSCPVGTMHSPFVADFDIPLLPTGGGDDRPAVISNLGPLAGLIGTWISTRTNGFNVMPIPQATAPNGFILKNFFYYEVMTFSAIQGKVTNRGGVDEQDCYTLFYEQRVFFSDGEQADQLVHAENGTWLNLITGPQGQGPLNAAPEIPSPPAPDPIPPQDPARQIVKLISVPHGTSILAMGNVTPLEGVPDIPDVSALPLGAPAGYNQPYGPELPDNPNINPNVVLKDALFALSKLGVSVVRSNRFEVDSDNQGTVANIPFLKKHTSVTRFSQTMWLEELSNGQLLLQYSQNIRMKFPQGRGKSCVFPHISANTLIKVK